MKRLKRLGILLLSALVGLLFVGCAQGSLGLKTLEDAAKRMEAGGYTTERTEANPYLQLLTPGCQGVLWAEKAGGEEIDIYLFDTKENAESFRDRMEMELNGLLEDQKMVLDGKWLYVGTANAIRVFEGKRPLSNITSGELG